MRVDGIDGLSTRAVAIAAGVQPPVIYRQFGNKNRLLDAVTLFVFEKYIAEKRRLIATCPDPLRELKQLWDLHVDFGLTNPDCYLLAYVYSGRTTASACAAQSFDLLREVVAQLGSEGRLRMSVERATALLRSSAKGVVLTLIALPPQERDLQVSHIMRDNTLAQITYDEPELVARLSDISARADELRQRLRHYRNCRLTSAERALLAEWLHRLADDA